jgi:alpha-L-fucosidase
MHIIPSEKQNAFLSWELGVFFHFGIRTFYEGHKDWDMKFMPPEGFTPSNLDCNQWIQTIKEAGAKYAILVAKHHDGFANWPSKYTDYSVANTPWKDGKGDVVEEFVTACRKFDVKVGIYYSPADFGMKERKWALDEYDDYIINQLSELLTNYGKIDYIWFDGCGSEDQMFNPIRITEVVRRLQPDILIFNMWDPDTRWIGNEDGISPYPNFNTVNTLDFSVITDKQVEISETLFLPGECDCLMRQRNWYFSENDVNTVKTLEQLIGMYYLTIGRGANMLLNIGPDRRGLLPETDAQRFLELGREIKRRFSIPLAKTEIKDCNENNKYILNLNKDILVNHVIITEDMSQGESIKHFKIYIKTPFYGKSIIVYDGLSIGNKAICQFPTVETSEITLEITDYDKKYSVKDISAYFVK